MIPQIAINEMANVVRGSDYKLGQVLRYKLKANNKRVGKIKVKKDFLLNVIESLNLYAWTSDDECGQKCSLVIGIPESPNNKVIISHDTQKGIDVTIKAETPHSRITDITFAVLRYNQYNGVICPETYCSNAARL
jgi:hypothetical protein